MRLFIDRFVPAASRVRSPESLALWSLTLVLLPGREADNTEAYCHSAV
jgi:hypothetical protein